MNSRKGFISGFFRIFKRIYQELFWIATSVLRCDILNDAELSALTFITIYDTLMMRYDQSASKSFISSNRFPIPCIMDECVLKTNKCSKWTIETLDKGVKYRRQEWRLDVFCSRHFELRTYFTHFSSVFTIDFDQVNVSWDTYINSMKVVSVVKALESFISKVSNWPIFFQL